MDMDLWHLGVLLILTWLAWLNRRLIVYYLRSRHLLNRTFARYVLLSSSDVVLSSLIHLGGFIGMMLVCEAYYSWYVQLAES